MILYCHSSFSTYVHYLFSTFLSLTLLVFYRLLKFYSLMSEIVLTSTSSFLLPGSGDDNIYPTLWTRQGHLTGSGQWAMPLLMKLFNAWGSDSLFNKKWSIQYSYGKNTSWFLSHHSQKPVSDQLWYKSCDTKSSLGEERFL